MTANKKGNRGVISKARALLVLLGASAVLASLSGESTEYQSNTTVSDTASPSFAADADGFLYSRWLDGTSADCTDLVCDGAAELGDETYGSFVIAEKRTTGKTAADVAEVWRRAAGRVGTAFSLSSLGRRALDYTVNDKEMKIADWWRQVYRDTYLGTSDTLTDNLLYAGEQSLEKASFIRTADIDFRSSLGNRPWQLGLNVLGSLREKSDEVIAWQLRGYTGEKESKGGNAGLIYRKARGEALLGINAFLDYEHARTGGGFWRWSYGGEIRTERVDFYANHYLGITDGKRQSDGTYLYTAGGYDVELDVHLMREISGFLSYYEWEGKYGDEKESGYRYGLKFREIGGSGLNVELLLDKPEGKKTHAGGNVLYRHEFGLPARGSQRTEIGFDPRDYFFEPVRREYSQRIRHSLKKATVQDQVFVLTGGIFQLLEGGQTVASLVDSDVPYTFEVKDGLTLSTGIQTTAGVKRLNGAYTLTLHANTGVTYRDSGTRLELFTGTVDILRNGAVASNLTVIQAGTRTLTLLGTRPEVAPMLTLVKTRLKIAPVSNTLRGTLYEGIVEFVQQPGMDLAVEGGITRVLIMITIVIDGMLVPMVTVVEVGGGCGGEDGKPSTGNLRIGDIEITIGSRSRCASEAGASNLSFNDGYLLPLVASLNQAMTLATLATYVKGGKAPYTYGIVAGTPTVLGINPDSGVLSVRAPGLLKATGVLLTVRVSDNAQNTVIGIIEVRTQGRISLALPTTQVLRAPHRYEGVLGTLWAVNGSGSGYSYAINSTSSAVGLSAKGNVLMLAAAVDGPRTLNVTITVMDGQGSKIESPLTVVIDASLSLMANAAHAGWKIPLNYVGKVATLVAGGGSGKADYRYGIAGTSPHFEVIADMLRIKSGTSSPASLTVTVEVSDKARIPQKARTTVTVTVLAIFGVHLREVTAASYGYTGSVALLSAFGGSGDYSHTVLAAGPTVLAATVSGNLLTLSLSQAMDSGTTLTITVITRDGGNNELKTTTIPVRGLLPVSLTLPPVTEMMVAHAYRGILLTLAAPVGGDGNYQYDWGNSAFTLRPAAEGKRELLLTRAISGLSTVSVRVWDSSVRPLTATVVVTVAALEKVSLSLSGLSLTLSHRQTGVLATVTSTGGNAAWHKYVGTGAGITLAVTGGALLLTSAVSGPAMLKATVQVTLSDSRVRGADGAERVLMLTILALPLAVTVLNVRGAVLSTYTGSVALLSAFGGSGNYSHRVLAAGPTVEAAEVSGAGLTLSLAQALLPRTTLTITVITRDDGKVVTTAVPITGVAGPLSLSSPARALAAAVAGYTGVLATLTATDGSGSYRYTLDNTDFALLSLADKMVLSLTNTLSALITATVTVEVSDTAVPPATATVVVSLLGLAEPSVTFSPATTAFNHRATGIVGYLNLKSQNNFYDYERSNVRGIIDLYEYSISIDVVAVTIDGYLPVVRLIAPVDGPATLVVTVKMTLSDSRVRGSGHDAETVLTVTIRAPLAVTVLNVTAVVDGYTGSVALLSASGGSGNYSHTVLAAGPTVLAASVSGATLTLSLAQALPSGMTLTITMITRDEDGGVLVTTRVPITRVVPVQLSSPARELAAVVAGYTGVLATLTATYGNGNYRYTLLNSTNFALLSLADKMVLSLTNTLSGLVTALVTVEVSDTAVPPTTATVIVSLVGLAKPSVAAEFVHSDFYHRQTGHLGFYDWGLNGNYYDYDRNSIERVDMRLYQFTTNFKGISLSLGLEPTTGLLVSRMYLTATVDGPATLTVTLQVTLSDSRVRGVDGAEKVSMLRILAPLAVTVLNVRMVSGGYTGSVALLSASGGSGNYSHTVLAAGTTVLAASVSGERASLLTLSLAQALPSGTILTITVITREDGGGLVTTAVPITGEVAPLSLSSPARALAAVAAGYTGVLATLTATGGYGGYRYTLNNTNFALLSLGDKMVLSLTNRLSGLTTVWVTVAVSDTAASSSTATVVVSLLGLAKPSATFSPHRKVFKHRNTGRVGKLIGMSNGEYYDYETNGLKEIKDLYEYITNNEEVSVNHKFSPPKLNLTATVDGPATLMMIVQVTLSDSRVRGVDGGEMTFMLTILAPLVVTALNVRTAPGGYTGSVALLSVSGGSGNYSHVVLTAGLTVLAATVSGATLVLSLAQVLPSGAILTITVITRDEYSEALVTTAVPITGVAALVSLSSPARALAAVVAGYTGVLATLTATGGNGSYRYALNNTDFALLSLGDKMVLSLTNTLSGLITATVTVTVSDTAASPSTATVVVSLIGLAKPSIFYTEYGLLRVIGHRVTKVLGLVNVVNNGIYYDYEVNKLKEIHHLYQYTTNIDEIYARNISSLIYLDVTGTVNGPTMLMVTVQATLSDSKVRGVDSTEMVFTLTVGAPLRVKVLNVRTAPEGYTGSVALLSASGGGSSSNYHSHVVLTAGPAVLAATVRGSELLTLSLSQALQPGTTLTITVITREVNEGKVVTTAVAITGLAGPLSLSSLVRELAAVVAGYTGVLATLTATGGNGHYHYRLNNTNFALLSLGDKMVLSLTNTLNGLITATVTVAVSDTAVPPTTATVVVSLLGLAKLKISYLHIYTVFYRSTGYIGYIGYEYNGNLYDYETNRLRRIVDLYKYTTSFDGISVSVSISPRLLIGGGAKLYLTAPVDGPATLIVTVQATLSESRVRGGDSFEYVSTLTIPAPQTTQNQGYFPMFSDSTFTALSGESESEIRFASDKKRPFLDDEVQSFDRATGETGRWGETTYDTRRIRDIYLE